MSKPVFRITVCMCISVCITVIDFSVKLFLIPVHVRIHLCVNLSVCMSLCVLRVRYAYCAYVFTCTYVITIMCASLNIKSNYRLPNPDA